jgi:hypothetical protein
MSNENSNHQTRNPKQTCPEQHRTDPNYKNSKLKVEQYDKLPEQII